MKRTFSKEFKIKACELLLKFRWWEKSVEEINDLIPILTNSNLVKVEQELRTRI